MKKAALLLVLMIAVLPFVFAKSFASSAFYGQVQSVQQPVQKDNVVITSFPRWNSSGDYSYEAWHGTKNVITGDITFSRMWGARIITKNYTAQPRQVNRVLTRESSTINFRDIGRYNADCKKGETRCEGKVYSKCALGKWLIAQTCRRNQECTIIGCVYS